MKDSVTEDLNRMMEQDLQYECALVRFENEIAYMLDEIESMSVAILDMAVGYENKYDFSKEVTIKLKELV